MTRHIALANCQNISFNLKKNDGENVNIRIDCYFRAHMEYTRPDVGLKIYREAPLHGIFKPTSGRLYSICARK